LQNKIKLTFQLIKSNKYKLFNKKKNKKILLHNFTKLNKILLKILNK